MWSGHAAEVAAARVCSMVRPTAAANGRAQPEPDAVMFELVALNVTGLSLLVDPPFD